MRLNEKYKDGEETKAIDPENYEVTYADNVKAGTGTATVTFRSDRYEIEPVALTFEITKAANTMTVKGKTGKVTVKKGLKKGTYKVKVNVTAAGDANHNKVTKPATVTIKVR